jgi:hypothetical protein
VARGEGVTLVLHVHCCCQHVRNDMVAAACFSTSKLQPLLTVQLIEIAVLLLLLKNALPSAQHSAHKLPAKRLAWQQPADIGSRMLCMP